MSSDPSFVYNKCTDTTAYAYGNACKEKHDRSRCNTGDDTMYCFWSYDFSDSKKFKSDTKKCRTVPDAMIPTWSEVTFKFAKNSAKNQKQGQCIYGPDPYGGLDTAECDCKISWDASEKNGWKSQTKMGRCAPVE